MFGIVLLVGVAEVARSTVAEPAATGPAEVAATIDRHFDRYWKATGLEHAPIADDATFLRRVTLDLVGRIPTAVETRAFLDAHDPQKRRLAIERLIEAPAHARHFAFVWRRIWLPQTNVAPHDYLGDELELWLTAQFQERAPYDRIVRHMLSVAAPTLGSEVPALPGGKAPVTFLLANDMRPEELAANATREFLGVNLECAQCHDHPFATWKREEFWRTAAFFAPCDGQAAIPEIKIPESDETAVARLWTGEELIWPTQRDPAAARRMFAEWVTSPQNKLFARNAVNRLWAHLLGAGLHQPIDDLAGAEQSPHFELIETLAENFAKGGFSLDDLTEAILLSRVYELSVRQDQGSRPPSLHASFSTAAVRSLSGEQLYDSLRLATGHRLLQTDLDSADALHERRRFVEAFQAARADKPQRSVLQALALMNGSVTQGLIDPASSPLVAVASEGPFFDRPEKVRFLFLTILSRLPTPEELETLTEQLAQAEREGDSRSALADMCWAMLNSVEFNTNH